MNTTASAKERLQPISRELERSLVKLIGHIAQHSADIDVFTRNDKNQIVLNDVFEQEHEESQAVLKILNKFLAYTGHYFGPRHFAVAYEGDAVVCNVGPEDVDGFSWLSGLLKIERDFGFRDNSQVVLKFGHE